jgi:UDP-GlcNAc:undecaprenyl-phosphate/decaprenyl-phosphate GlcNAc-1-phosphate transferase
VLVQNVIFVTLLAFLSAGALGVLLTPLVRDTAVRHGLGQRGNTARGVHTRPIPRLGGLAIVAAFLLPLVGLALLHPAARQAFSEHARLSVAMLLGGLAIAGLGVFDDLKGARASQKLAVQVAVAVAMYVAGFRIDDVTNPLGGTISLGWLGLPFTVLWITGVVNAMNLVDGLDGLAGGVAFFAVLTTLVAALWQGELFMALCSAAMAGAVLGFLRYNFNPATIFMGDTGSMFLGFVLAVTAIHAHEKTSAAVAIAVPILALGVPIADTLLAMGRRAVRGAPIFSADRGHIHHRLLDRGLSHRQAVLVLYASASALAVGALLLSFLQSLQAFLLLSTVAVLGFVALRTLGFFDLARTGELLALRRRTLALRVKTGEAVAGMRGARDPSALRVALREGAAAVGAVAVGLAGAPAEAAEAVFSEGFDGAGEELLRAQFAVGGPGGTLELGWGDGRAAVDRETQVAVEHLRETLGDALERLAVQARRGEVSGAAAQAAWRA